MVRSYPLFVHFLVTHSYIYIYPFMCSFVRSHHLLFEHGHDIYHILLVSGHFFFVAVVMMAFFPCREESTSWSYRGWVKPTFVGIGEIFLSRVFLFKRGV